MHNTLQKKLQSSGLLIVPGKWYIEITEKENKKRKNMVILKEDKNMKIVGVCACTVGIAHTYIAQEKLEQAAKKAGFEAKFETQGSIGRENELTAQEIADADIVILAIDIQLGDMSRFEGKKIMKVPTDVAIKAPNKLMAKAKEVVDAAK